MTLAASGAVSGEEISHAQAAVNERARRARQRQGRARVGAAIARDQPDAHRRNVGRRAPQCRARGGESARGLSRVRAHHAAVSGFGLRRKAHRAGRTRVAAGASLMSVIPLEQLWVDANFKEVQLRRMRIGQPVKLTADAYGGRVEYHGTIAGVGVGTGAAFALLPAQNATGNWIKVVQRIPVRIALDPQELAAHPLVSDCAMEVAVDVATTTARRLPRRLVSRRPIAPRCSITTPRKRTAHAEDDRRQPRRGGEGEPGRDVAPRAPCCNRGAESLERSGGDIGKSPGGCAAVTRRTCHRFARSTPRAPFHRLRNDRFRHLERPGRAAGAAAARTRHGAGRARTAVGRAARRRHHRAVGDVHGGARHVDRECVDPGHFGDVGVSTSQGTWVITSFAVSNAIAVPLTGWLDAALRLGPRVFAVRAAVRAVLVAVRPRAEPRVADRVPRDAGPRRGTAHSPVAGAAAVELSAGEGGNGARDVVDDHADRSGGRAPPRRMDSRTATPGRGSSTSMSRLGCWRST